MIYLLVVLFLTMLLAVGTIAFSKNWKFSAMVCLLIAAICSVAYFYSQTQRGLPIEGQLPKRFVFLGVSVKEPDSNSAGAIYYWIRPIPSDNNRTPISVQMPYSKQAHQQAQEIQRRLRSGQGVQARRATPSQGQTQGRQGLGQSQGRGKENGQRLDQEGQIDDDQLGSQEGNATGSGNGNHGEQYSPMEERLIPNYEFELVEPDTVLPPKDGNQETAPVPPIRNI